MAGVDLGSFWGTLAPELPPPDPVLERDPQTALLLEMRDLLEGLRSDLLGLPRPLGQEFDLTALTQAISATQPNLSADQIGAAVAAAVAPMIPAPKDVDLTVLGEVSKALDKLDFRMRGTGGGGSLSPDITDRASRQLGQVRDAYGTCEVLPDQAGSGSVLTFTFSTAVQMFWVTDTSAASSAVSRVTTGSDTPTASHGIPVFNQAPCPVTVTTAAVSVYAPNGTNIVVHGFRY